MIVDGVGYRSSEILEVLIKRDGLECKIPGCRRPKDFDDEGDWSANVDHRIPRSREGLDTWSNLQVSHISCNSRRGNRLILPDGTLEPVVKVSKPPKPQKKTPCDSCFEGRLLLEGESCPDCGIGPQPVKFPKYLQRDIKSCDHSVYHCAFCVMGVYERKPAYSDVFGVSN